MFNLADSLRILCRPISAYWTFPQPANAKCFNDGMSMQAAAVFNTVSEFWIATLPLIACFKLRVDRSQRWTVIGLLSLGYFVSVAGIGRTFYIFKSFTTYDITWWSGPQWIFAEVEIDLAIVSVFYLSQYCGSPHANDDLDECMRRSSETTCQPYNRALPPEKFEFNTPTQ